jgi:hypothetical protein
MLDRLGINGVYTAVVVGFIAGWAVFLVGAAVWAMVKSRSL